MYSFLSITLRVLSNESFVQTPSTKTKKNNVNIYNLKK